MALSVHTWALVAALLGPEVELEWRAPAGCPDQTAVLADVARLLAGRTLAAPVAVAAEIVAGADGYAATVAIGQTAPRTLRASSCAPLARAVALVIAVAIDPVRLAENLVVPSPPPPVIAAVELPVEPVEPAPVVLAPAPPVRDEPRPRPPSQHRLGVRGGMLAGASTLPTGAVGLHYALTRGLLRVEARATYATPRRLVDDDGVGMRVQALTIGALGCVAPGSGWLQVPLCLGLEAGPLIARGVGIPAPRLRADLWASGLLGAAVVARVHRRVALVLGVEFAAALRRPAFAVGDREAPRAPAFGGRIALGVEFVLGPVTDGRP